MILCFNSNLILIYLNLSDVTDPVNQEYRIVEVVVARRRFESPERAV